MIWIILFNVFGFIAIIVAVIVVYNVLMTLKKDKVGISANT